MGTFNVRTQAFNGKNGLGHAEEILDVCRQSSCDVVGLRETRRDDRNGFTAAGYAVYCSGSGGGVAGAKGQHGVWLAIKETVLQNVIKDCLDVEYINS